MILYGNPENLKFKTVLLDFDGVVADTESVFANFDCALINEFLGTSLTPEYVRILAGMSGEEKLQTIAHAKQTDATPHIETFIARRNTARKTLFKEKPPALAPGLFELLEKHDGRYAIVTNKERSKLETDLECIGITDNFAGRSFCFENGLAAKPAPDILLAAMKAMDMKSSETIFIGDNTIDMEAALAAECAPIGFVCGDLIDHKERTEILSNAGAVIVITDLNDLSSSFLNFT